MFKFLDVQPSVFGLDIGDLTIRLVGLKKNRHGFTVDFYNEIPLSAGVVKEGAVVDKKALIQAISKSLVLTNGKRVKTNYVVASLPEERAFSQIIQMPPMSQEELALTVPREAGNYIPLPLESVYLDYQVIQDVAKEDPGHIDVLVQVMPKTIVDDYMACLQQVGLVPYALETESQAIARALIKDNIPSAPVLFLDIGGASTSLAVYGRGAVRFSCSIPVVAGDGGANADVAAMAKEMAIHIKKYMAFYYGHVQHVFLPNKNAIEKVVLCGGGAKITGLVDALSKEMQMPVGLGDPLVNVVGSHGKEGYLLPYEKALSFTAAIGLALRSVQTGK